MKKNPLKKKVAQLTLNRETLILLHVGGGAHPIYTRAPCDPPSPPATCPPA
jgi:hypothetical protein